MEFVKGKDLCRSFFNTCAKPIIEKFFPELEYSAGLLGYGSDVLGFDDAVSTDHMWGPRFYLFLKDSDIRIKDDMLALLGEKLPFEFMGYSVNFSEPNYDDGGVRVQEQKSEGTVSPLIFIYTIDEFLISYLGKANIEQITYFDWLSFSENRLLALKNAEFYVDFLNVEARLKPFGFYPEQVRLYLLASSWEMISQEQAFVRRCGDVDDEIGSRLITARIAERLMRLAFLYEEVYAPYSKWFGTGFKNLHCSVKLGEIIEESLCAIDKVERGELIAQAQLFVANLHDKAEITESVNAKIQNYFGRDIKVIYAGEIADKIFDKLKGTSFEGLPPIGSMSQIPSFTTFFDNPTWSEKIKGLYK